MRVGRTSNFDVPRDQGATSHTRPLPECAKFLFSLDVSDPGCHRGTMKTHWKLAGNLTIPRGWHTASLLPTGKVLIAGGLVNPNDTSLSLAASSAELYHHGSWSITNSLNLGRESGHVMTHLHDGRVLITGGDGGGGPEGRFVVTAEAFNPVTETWELAGRLNEGRWYHTATLLDDRTVLVAGGLGNDAFLASVELYDPATGTWSTVAPLSGPRLGHTATRLRDGEVLVGGGAPDGGVGDPMATTDLYDPSLGTWSPGPLMNIPRLRHTAVFLHGGKVLVAGGLTTAADPLGFNPTASAELYDPYTGIWSITGSMQDVRFDHTATVLEDGMVLVTGGADGTTNDVTGDGVVTVRTPTASAELYDPKTGVWTGVRSMHVARVGHAATRLKGGIVLVAGGTATDELLFAFLASSEVFTFHK